MHRFLYTKDFACRLMAFIDKYHIEIGEETVLNLNLKWALRNCRIKLHIVPYGIVGKTTIKRINKYLKELDDNPDWKAEIIKRYGLNKIFKRRP